MDNLNKYKNMTPGKYWKLPKNKKHRINEFLNDDTYIPMVKYDGYWARVIIEEDGITIQSRGKSKVTGTFGEYQEKVPHIVEELRNYPAGTVLLGELHYPELTQTIKNVSTILLCNPQKARDRQKKEEKKLHFSLFDLLAYNYIDYMEKPFEERLTMLSNSHSKFDTQYVHVAEYGAAGHGEDLLGKVWDQGGEGIILLHKDLPYNLGGAKAWHSIKVKRELPEIEAPIVDLIEPETLYKGKELNSWKYWGVFDGDELVYTAELNVGGIENAQKYIGDLYDGNLKPISKFYYNEWKKGIVVKYKGNQIKMTSGITEEEGQYLSTDEAYEKIRDGKLYAVFTGMEITEDSVRHPRVIRIRDDI
ncbi:MAG: hypothetical protein ACOCRO_05550 [Halanaerobiales bacterium]